MFGDIRHWKLFDIAQQERIAQQWRNAVNFAVQERLHFFASDLLFRSRTPVARFANLPVVTFSGIVNVLEARSADLSQAHQTLIYDDSCQPRRDVLPENRTKLNMIPYERKGSTSRTQVISRSPNGGISKSRVPMESLQQAERN